MEKYLSVVQTSETRSYVATFRISAHKFPIGTGRYVNIEQQNRTCTLCERGIGDELHYFSNCKNVLLQMTREKHIGHIKKNIERFSLFNEMRSCSMMVQLYLTSWQQTKSEPVVFFSTFCICAYSVSYCCCKLGLWKF